MKGSLRGTKYISIGGGNDNGRITAARLTDLVNAINAGTVKNDGWDGIAFDVEVSDSGLATNYAQAFAAAKKAGLIVVVTVSHSTPYEVADGVALMRAFFPDVNIDMISPQLYTSGAETYNDFTENGVAFSEYKSAKAKIVPAIASAGLYEDAKKQFQSRYGISVGGYFSWN